MQNTMVWGGGMVAGEKIEKITELLKRGKKNGGKFHKKTGEKALKMHLFGL